MKKAEISLFSWIVIILAGILSLSTCTLGLGNQVDTKPPVVSISDPAADSYRCGAVAMGGKASDETSLKSVSVTLRDTTTSAEYGPYSATLNSAKTAWSLTVNEKVNGSYPIPDGTYECVATATDHANRVNTSKTVFTIDNTPPSVLVTMPLSYGAGNRPQYSSYIDIKGEIYDTSPITNVHVSLRKADGTVLAQNDAKGTNIWSIRFLLKDALFGDTSWEAEPYYYNIKATDKAGNVNDYYYHELDIYDILPSGKLFPTMDEIGELDKAATGIAPVSGIAYADLVAKRLATGATPVYADFSFKYASLADISFTNLDRSAPQNSNLLGVGAPITGLVTPPSGAGAIQQSSFAARIYADASKANLLYTYLYNDSNVTLKLIGDSLSFVINLKDTLGNQIAPGPYYMEVTAQALGTDAAVQPVAFVVDSTVPILTETTIGSATQATKDKIKFAGHAISAIDLTGGTIEIRQGYNDNNTADYTPVQTIALVGGTDVEWTSADMPAGSNGDGNYYYQIILTTPAAKTASLERSIIYDTDAPDVVLNTITPEPAGATGKINGSVYFKAGISDGNGISEARWKIAATVPAWADCAVLAVPYDVTFDSTDSATYPAGAGKLWILAKDKAGNVATFSRNVDIDQESDRPVLTLTTAGGSSITAGGGISGTLKDDDGFGSATITVWNASNAKVVDAQALTLAGSGLNRSFTWPVTGLADGAYHFMIDAVDSNGGEYGQSATMTAVNFYYDTKLPDLTETAVGTMDSKYLKSGTISFAGAASDTNALAGLTVSVNGGSANAVPVTAGSWGYTFDSSGKSDGSYALVFTATDAANNTKSVTRNVVVDKTAPSLTLSTINGGASGTFTAWKGTQTLSVTGSASDATSGVKTIEYQTNDNPTWNPLSGTTGWSGSVSVTGATTQVLLRVTDNAGNTATTTQAVNIDLSSPVIAVTTPASIARVGTAALATVSTGTDSGSGIVSVLLRVNSQDFSGGTTSASLSSGSATNGTWSASIPSSAFSSLADGSQYPVYVQAIDGVGNKTISSFSVMVDKTPPSAAFTAPAASVTVNKLIAVSGTGSDVQALSSVVVSIQKSDSSWVTLQTFNGTAGFNWSIPNFNTETYGVAAYDSDSGTAGIQLTLRAVATDEAGNAFTATRAFTVDQDSDRPVVILSNVNVDGNTTLKMSNTVFGSVSDDDGVATLEISGDGSSWTTETLSAGSWSYAASAGDGPKKLYFRVTDTAGGIFTTDQAYEPKVQYGASVISTYVSFKVDTLAPELSSANPVVIDRTSAYDFADAQAISANMPLGGGSGGVYSKFALRVLAKDVNGIASVSVAVPGASGSPFAATSGGTDAAEPTFTRFDTGAIDVSSLADGAVTITVTVTDNSGLTSSVNRTVLIDNTVPTVTHSSPRHQTDVVNGNVTVKGHADDGTGSGLASIKYQLGLCADRSAASASWLNASGSLFSWEIDLTDSNKIDGYAGIPVAIDTGTDTFTLNSHGYANGTAVYFDGSTLASGMSQTTAYYVINATANTFQVSTTAGGSKVDFSGSPASISVSKYSKDTDNNGIWELPILIRAADAAGNVLVEDYTTYVVLVDPSGDRPTVSIVYPDPDATGRTMGGTIRIFGTAIDDDAVGTVYMQIDVDGDGDYDTSDVDSTGKDWYAGGLGQAVSGTASWNQTINASGEFNPGGSGTRTIHFRVRAKDIYGTYGGWSANQTIEVDNKLPKIGSTNALTFTKGASSRGYVADMWLNGTWNLTGSIEDESGIASVTVTSSVPALNGDLSTSGWFTAVPAGGAFGTNSGYTMNIPVPTSGTGSLTFTITVFDKSEQTSKNSVTISVNYDNDAPTIGGYTGSTPVTQSNKVYSLSSSVTETGSGFEKLGFYFERNVSTDSLDRVYNPMEARTGDANRTYLNTLTMIDGLPCAALSGVTRSDQYSLTSASIKTDLNIRKGGLVYVGGQYRYILSVDRTAGAITWADAVPTTVTTASVAYAMIVNNTTVETPVWSGDTLSSITNDDGDGMVEAVERSGGLYNWTASIDSRNIPDGPIEIHFVAYDKAGNYTTGVVSTSVQNNRPLLAKVTLGTDLNGNGAISADEQVTPFSALDGSGGKQATATVASSGFIAKDLTSVDIDVVGGNGILGYTVAYNSALLSGYNDPVTANILRASEAGAVASISLSAAALSSIGDTIYTDVSHVLHTDAAKSLVFKIWDSTEETTRGTNSQYATLTVPMQIDITDDVNPKATITPFYWTSASDNSLYGNSKSNGHIEITGVVDNADPDVSGQISIRGTAYDDTRLSSLWLSIADTLNVDRFSFAGSGPTKTLNGRTYYEVAAYNPSTASWVGTDQWAANGWKFTVTPVSLTQGGHTVSWQLDWDTAKVKGSSGLLVAALNNCVRIEAEDKRTTTNAAVTAGSFAIGNYYRIETVGSTSFTSIGALANGVGVIFKATGVGSGTDKATLANPNASDENTTTQTATGALTPYYSMDVVPYITGVTTNLSQFYNAAPSVFSRTAKGDYPVRESETVTLNGFNFNGASTTAKLNGTTIAVTTTATPLTSILVNVGTTATSGKLDLLVNSVSSINNSDSNDSEINKSPNAVNNNLLNDDVVLDVWNFQETGWSKGGGINNPNMKVGPQGQIGFSFGHSVVYFSMPGQRNGESTFRSQTAFQKNYGWFTANNFAFDAKGNTYGVALCPDTGGNAGESANFSFFSRQAGLSINSMSLDGNYGYSSGGTNNGREGAYNWRLSNTSQYVDSDNDGSNDDGITDIFRVYSPEVATTMQNPDNDPSSTNLVSVYLAYYDNLTKEIRFRYGTVGSGPGDISSGLDDFKILSGGSNRQRSTKYAPDIPIANYQVISTSGFFNTSGGRTTASTYQPGKYVALGVLRQSSTNDVAMIAWYDSTDRKLYFSYNTDPKSINEPASRAQWQAHAICVDSTLSTGAYVKMAIDSGGGIHLVYYSLAGGDLKYAYLSDFTDTVADIAKVDSFLSVGTNCTIDVAKDASGHQVPYIGYYMAANSGTCASARVAWRVNFPDSATPAPTATGQFDGANASDFYTGNWEISTVPEDQNTIPADSQVSVGVYRNSSGALTAIPKGVYSKVTESNTLPLSETCTVYGNGSTNPVIGYATQDGVLKMAQKK